MTLALDQRQRAMLAEIGLRGFAAVPLPAVAQEPAAPPVAIRAPRPAVAEPTIARSTPVPAAPAIAPQPVVRLPAGPVAQMDWEALAQAVAGCRACGLCERRHTTVFGVGDLQPDWLVVGEAPGEQEDLQGEPFVGQAGKLLDNMLRALGVDRRRKVYIANVLKCRPPGNRNPEPAEVAQCEPFLRRQVELLRPKIILALGRFAVQSLLGSTEPIGRLRGRVHQYQGVPLVVTYHPAYLLRNLPEKAKAWADLCLALEQLRAQAG
ncbi:uracil-DNA glycosylase [Ramlibacter sp.]|uniref:uracil-DNA glycosylase n=1 Tax=Ramlibacter sp. TaxID=1917967 RepID=UPI002C0AE464|nr:uracil-DNA glycosylase [Ramlibacter sp.]HWI82804.1 uracil-DNA glycosylase [Ramlibacter sp.]